jgi:phosphoribosylformylglycinamidine synthase PurS subunit
VPSETPNHQERRVARVVVDVMLKPEILDPAGQAVAGALPRLGVTDVASVRIGKRIEIDFTGRADLDRAREIADRLLANPVIEDFTIHFEDGEADGEETGEQATPAPARVPTVHSTVGTLPPGTKLIHATPVEVEPTEVEPVEGDEK